MQGWRCSNETEKERRQGFTLEFTAFDMIGTSLAEMIPLKCHNRRFIFQRLIVCRRKQTNFGNILNNARYKDLK